MTYPLGSASMLWPQEQPDPYAVPPWQPPAPTIQPGPEHYDFADRLALALSQMQFGQPHNFGEGLATGLATGFSGGRVQQISQRQKINDALRTQAVEKDKENLAASLKAREGSFPVQLQGALKKAQIDQIAKQAYPVGSPKAPAPKPTLQEIEAESEARARGSAKGTAAAGGSGDPEVDAVVEAIITGKQSPETKGLYRKTLAVRAGLAGRGYDLKSAQQDWQAVQRTVATLNGPQQTRLRQAAETAYHSLDVIDQLNDRLQALVPRSSWSTLNRAGLAAIKNLPGEPGEVARQLDAQIADVTSELGNVYMGGNSPTDHALQLAAKNLSGNWSAAQLKSMTALARKNLAIRRNSITNTKPVSLGNDPNDPAGVRSKANDPLGIR